MYDGFSKKKKVKMTVTKTYSSDLHVVNNAHQFH